MSLSTDEILKILKSRLSKHRLIHTLSVTQTALEYAEILKSTLAGREVIKVPYKAQINHNHGLQVAMAKDDKTEVLDDAYIAKLEKAALLHDICKEIPNLDMLELANFYGIKIYDEDRLVPNILHGRVGKAYLEDHYGIYDPVITAPVCNHTFGAPNMRLATKIIYLADMLEPGRDAKRKEDPSFISDLDPFRERLENLASSEESLEDILLDTIDQKLLYVLAKRHPIHPLSIEARNVLIESLKNC